MQQDEQDQQPQVVYVKDAGNALAVAALIVGVGGLMFGLAMFILFPIALALGATAVILGILGRRKATREPRAGHKKMATWGLILGIATLGCGIAGAVVVQTAVDDLDEAVEQFDRDMEDAGEQFDRDMQEVEDAERDFDREMEQVERETEEALRETEEAMSEIDACIEDYTTC